VFNQLGDVERRALRPGNLRSADGWRTALEPVVARYRGIVKRLHFRGDAAFANRRFTSSSKPRAPANTIRGPANRGLQDRIGHLLKSPVGRPPREACRYYASFSYRAQRWKKAEACHSEGRMAFRRALSPRGLHRDQSGAARRARGRLLQPAGHGGAMDQRGLGRDHMDPAVMPISCR